MSKFSLFAIEKFYFTLIFNSISGNCDPPFSQIIFVHKHFLGEGLSGGGGGYVLEPIIPDRVIATQSSKRVLT